MKKNHFSLIVVTKDRLDVIERLFSSLSRQEYKNFSVIFVYENTCNKLATTLIDCFSDAFSIMGIATGPVGVARARNIAFPHISGEYVAFPDDDCWYLPDTLAKIAQIFTDNPSVGGILATRISHANSLPEDNGALSEVSRFSAFRGSETFLQFYLRSCVDRIGKFDETLGSGTGLPYGSGEDTDYVLRAVQKGYIIGKTLSVGVCHPDVDFDSPSLQQKTTAYANGRMYLLRKHNFPIWFRLANVFYPLAALSKDIWRYGLNAARWRWAMFIARIKFM